MISTWKKIGSVMDGKIVRSRLGSSTITPSYGLVPYQRTPETLYSIGEHKSCSKSESTRAMYVIYNSK